MACINDLTIACTSQFIDFSKRIATTPVRLSIRGGVLSFFPSINENRISKITWWHVLMLALSHCNTV